MQENEVKKILKEMLTEKFIEELKEEIKQNVIQSLKEDMEEIRNSIHQKLDQVDIEEYLEEDLSEDDLDLELWVRNIKEIFDIIDESEELSLKNLNYRFNKLVDLCAILLMRMRIIVQNNEDITKLVEGSESFGMIEQLSNKLSNEDGEIDKESVKKRDIYI